MTSPTTIITVLTTDIRNYTYHSRPYDREEDDDFFRRFDVLCDAVRDFHNLTIEIARSHDKQKEAVVLTTGDGLIIGFQDERHAATAYETAIDLQKAYVPFFRKLNKMMDEKRQTSSLGYGIGMHTGHVIVRQYISYHIPGTLNTIILGDALNISTRLESFTKDHPGCGIMLSEDTVTALTKQLGENAGQLFIDYQIHQIRGYRPLRLYGIPMPLNDE